MKDAEIIKGAVIRSQMDLEGSKIAPKSWNLLVIQGFMFREL